MFCKDCKYWEHTGDQYGKRWNECNKASWVNAGEDQASDVLGVYADASDDTGLQAGLITGPNFGCIHFLKIS